MGFFDFTALAGPVADQVVPFGPRAALLASLLGTLVVSTVGILWSSIRGLRLPRLLPRPARTPAAPVPALALAPAPAPRPIPARAPRVH
ncbi:MAG TPA: hypothetical protein VIS07_12235 [Candidatus Binatia bacterium]